MGVVSPELIIAIAATLTAGVIRTSVGVGAGIFLTASLSLIFDPKVSLAVMAFLQIAFGLSAIGHYWKKWDFPLVRVLTVCALIGVLVGTYLIATLPLDWVRRVLGIGLASIAVVELLRMRTADLLMRPANSLRGAAVTGVVSGMAGSMFNASGAVIAIYLRKVRLSHEIFLGTLSAVILSHDLLRLGMYWHFDLLDRDALIKSLLFVPFAFAGGWLGARVRHRISERYLAQVVLWIIIGLGGMLLLKN